jgi:predicted MFS family arabinose efflux permease
MPFKFGGPEMPMSLRWTRSLVYSEVVLLVFVVISYVIFTLLGQNTTSGVGVTSTTISGSTVVELILVLGLALLLGYLAVDLRNKRNSTRVVIAVIQAAMLVFGIVTSLSSPTSVALIVLLTGGTLYSLYAPPSNAAFAESAGGATKPAEAELPEELQKIFAEAKKAKEASASDEGPAEGTPGEAEA